jgi:hypothetical protein
VKVRADDGHYPKHHNTILPIMCGLRMHVTVAPPPPPHRPQPPSPKHTSHNAQQWEAGLGRAQQRQRVKAGFRQGATTGPVDHTCRRVEAVGPSTPCAENRRHKGHSKHRIRGCSSRGLGPLGPAHRAHRARQGGERLRPTLQRKGQFHVVWGGAGRPELHPQGGRVQGASPLPLPPPSRQTGK